MAFQFSKSKDIKGTKKRKLLVADDSITIQKLVNLTLAGSDFEIITSLDGHDARIKLKRLKPEFVLADVNLRELGGLKLCEEIRADQSLSDTKIIILFPAGSEAKGAAQNSDLADAILVKPFDSKALLDVIDRLTQSGIEEPEPGEDSEDTTTRKSIKKSAPPPAYTEEEPTVKRGPFSAFRDADESQRSDPKERLDAVADEILPPQVEKNEDAEKPVGPIVTAPTPASPPPSLGREDLERIAREEIRAWLEKDFPLIAEGILKEAISAQINKGNA